MRQESRRSRDLPVIIVFKLNKLNLPAVTLHRFLHPDSALCFCHARPSSAQLRLINLNGRFFAWKRFVKSCSAATSKTERSFFCMRKHPGMGTKRKNEVFCWHTSRLFPFFAGAQNSRNKSVLKVLLDVPNVATNFSKLALRMKNETFFRTESFFRCTTLKIFSMCFNSINDSISVSHFPTLKTRQSFATTFS